MGCGCGSSKSTTSSGEWVLTMPDGSKSTYSSKQAARLANRRLGGGGTYEQKD